jgi:hypothetical protein
MYFPDKSILQATAKSGMSYAWRRILLGLKLLKEGIIWRVGPWVNIEVFTDPWIPKGYTRRVRTDEMDEDMKVCDLIDPTIGQWDKETIKNTFGQQDLRDILSILLRQGMEDTIACHFYKKGVLLVRSCYQLGIHQLRDHQEQRDTSSSSNPAAQSPLWNTI